MSDKHLCKLLNRKYFPEDDCDLHQYTERIVSSSVLLENWRGRRVRLKACWGGPKHIWEVQNSKGEQERFSFYELLPLPEAQENLASSIEQTVGIIERDREFRASREKALAAQAETEKQERWQRLLRHPAIEGALKLGMLKEWRPLEDGLINLGPRPGSLYMDMGWDSEKLSWITVLSMDGAYEDWWFLPEKVVNGRARGSKSLTDEEFIAECERRLRQEHERVNS